MEGYYEGIVSSVDVTHGFVKVTYPQENDTLSDWLPLLAHEYNIPPPNTRVATILDKKGGGVCLGKIFSYSQTPDGAEGYAKDMDGIKITAQGSTFKIDFGGGAYMKYENGVVTVNADNIILNGYTPPD